MRLIHNAITPNQLISVLVLIILNLQNANMGDNLKASASRPPIKNEQKITFLAKIGRIGERIQHACDAHLKSVFRHLQRTDCRICVPQKRAMMKTNEAADCISKLLLLCQRFHFAEIIVVMRCLNQIAMML